MFFTFIILSTRTFNASGADNYLWSTGDTTSQITLKQPGNYSLIITSETGCIYNMDTAIANLPTLFTSSFLYQDVSCHGDSSGSISFIPIGGNAPYFYSIDNGNSFYPDSVFDSISIGTYYLRAMDLYGCLSYDTVILSEPTPLIANVSATDLACRTGTRCRRSLQGDPA